MTQSFQRIGIIGGGAWGTALALVLQRAGRQALLWAREAEVVLSVNTRHENNFFLPGIELTAQIRATNNLSDLAACDAVLLVTPTQYTRVTCKQFAKGSGSHKPPIIICAKGLEAKTGKLLTEIVSEELPDRPVAVLSGPSFAIEVARDKPAALTLAVEDKQLGAAIAQGFSSRHFRLYHTPDIIGAQIGGAIKNVMAVACGITAGFRMGDNARAAIITRGLAEMMRFGAALGGRSETLMGLSGLGDLVLTCSSVQSRNMSLGMALGQGTILADILAKRAGVTEGVFTAAAAAALARKHNIEMPICTAVDAVLNRGATLEDTIEQLLSRPLKAESDWSAPT